MVTIDFSRIDIKPGFKILDTGCGSGRHVGAAYYFDRVSITGIDCNMNDLKEAKKRLYFHDQIGGHGNGIWNLTRADIRCMPFEDNYFDLVICSEVLEHIKEQEEALLELVRVIKPGQTLVVSVPRYLPERICWLISNEYHSCDMGHIRIYKKDELIKLFTDFGLVYTSGHYAHSLHTPYWWLKCLAGLNNDNFIPVKAYHKLLVWDIMEKPRITKTLDKLFNPILGKSTVLYFKKPCV